VNPGDAPLPPPHRGRAILAQAGRRREEELGKEKEREEEQYVSKGILVLTQFSLSILTGNNKIMGGVSSS
jgi:hypothetical protein